MDRVQEVVVQGGRRRSTMRTRTDPIGSPYVDLQSLIQSSGASQGTVPIIMANVTEPLD